MSRPHVIELIKLLSAPELQVVARVLGANRGRRVKGGKYKFYKKQELLYQVRRALSRSTFPDRMERARNHIIEYSEKYDG